MTRPAEIEEPEQTPAEREAEEAWLEDLHRRISIQETTFGYPVEVEMDINAVKELRPGDTVHWSDPDEGLCSKDIKIKSIEIRQDLKTVILVDESDAVLECFAGELERRL